MFRIRTSLLVLCLASALPALAQQPGPWYIGAGVGQGHLNLSGPDLTGLTDASVDDTNTTYTVRMGFRPTPYWAVELGYYDLGKYQFHGSVSGATRVLVDGEARAKSVGLSVVGILPMGAFEPYARIGYARSELKVNASASLAGLSGVGNSKEKQNEATYGVGARWNAAPTWGMFAEWMKNDQIEVDSFLIGFDVRF